MPPRVPGDRVECVHARCARRPEAVPRIVRRAPEDEHRVHAHLSDVPQPFPDQGAVDNLSLHAWGHGPREQDVSNDRLIDFRDQGPCRPGSRIAEQTADQRNDLRILSATRSLTAPRAVRVDRCASSMSMTRSV